MEYFLKITARTIFVLSLLTTGALAQPDQASNDKSPWPQSGLQIALESELELNGGQKWRVDPAMMSHFRQMEKDLTDFNGKRSRDYHRLAEKLQNTLGELVSQCTMKGKAHDELHKWLLPFMENVESFSNETDAARLKRQFEELNSSFEVFNTHFR